MAVEQPPVLGVDPSHNALLDVLVQPVEPDGERAGCVGADDLRLDEHQEPRAGEGQLDPEAVSDARRLGRAQLGAAGGYVVGAHPHRRPAFAGLVDGRADRQQVSLYPQEPSPVGLMPVHARQSRSHSRARHRARHRRDRQPHCDLKRRARHGARVG